MGTKPPKLNANVMEHLPDDEIYLLLKACGCKGFVDKRDTAVVRLLLETGLQAREVLNLTVADVDLGRGLVTGRRGNGGKGCVGAIGAQTSSALGRRVRARRMHRLGSTPAFWVDGTDQTLGYHGVRLALLGRAALAGLRGFFIHKVRHTFRELVAG